MNNLSNSNVNTVCMSRVCFSLSLCSHFPLGGWLHSGREKLSLLVSNNKLSNNFVSICLNSTENKPVQFYSLLKEHLSEVVLYFNLHLEFVLILGILGVIHSLCEKTWTTHWVTIWSVETLV